MLDHNRTRCLCHHQALHEVSHCAFLSLRFAIIEKFILAGGCCAYESCRLFGVDASSQQEAFRFKELIFRLLSLAGTIIIGDYIPWLKWVTTVTGYNRYMKKVKADVDDMLQEFLELKKNGKSMNAAVQVASVDGKSPEHRDDFVDILLRQPAEDGTGHLSDTSIKALIQVHGEQKKKTYPSSFRHAALTALPELPKAC